MLDPARNAVIAVVGGSALFVALFVPILVIQFRRYGRLSVARLVGAAAASIYGVAVVAYTLFPLPVDTGRTCAPPVQLIPFHVIADISRETAGLPLRSVLVSAPVLQFVLNIALFVPWGVLVRRFFSRGIVFAIVSGLGLSLLIETTQYTGIWSLYGCAFRLADVDDLIANTGGSLVGALVAPLVLWWMPKGGELRQRRLEARPVTVRRRLLGMFLDWAFFSMLGTVFSLLAIDLPRGFGAPVPGSADIIVSTLVPGLLVFLVPSLLGSGASLGQRAVWLRPYWGDQSPTASRRIGRASVALAWTALLTIGAISPGSLIGLASLLAGLVAVIEVVAVTASRGRGLGASLVRATFIDSRVTSTTR
jgi:glycopeptide antibiotics resistance protein